MKRVKKRIIPSPPPYTLAGPPYDQLPSPPPSPHSQPPPKRHNSLSGLRRVLSRFNICSNPTSISRSSTIHDIPFTHSLQSTTSLHPFKSLRRWTSRADHIRPTSRHETYVMVPADPISAHSTQNMEDVSDTGHSNVTPLPTYTDLEEAEIEWRSQSLGLGEEARRSLEGARCLKIFDPFTGFVPSLPPHDSTTNPPQRLDFPPTIYPERHDHRIEVSMPDRSSSSAKDSSNEARHAPRAPVSLRRRVTPIKARQVLDRPRPVRRRPKVRSDALDEQNWRDRPLPPLPPHSDRPEHPPHPFSSQHRVHAQHRSVSEHSTLGPRHQHHQSSPLATSRNTPQYASPPMPDFGSTNNNNDQYHARRIVSDTSADHPLGPRLQMLHHLRDEFEPYYVPLRRD